MSVYSGWENDFAIGKLRGRDGSNVFGVSFDGPCVSGIVSSAVECELISQWEQVQHLSPSLKNNLDFKDTLAKVKMAPWYIEATKKFGFGLLRNQELALFGEDQGLSIFFMFSKVCLLLANEADEVSRDTLMKASMSVLLPIVSQNFFL